MDHYVYIGGLIKNNGSIVFVYSVFRSRIILGWIEVLSQVRTCVCGVSCFLEGSGVLENCAHHVYGRPVRSKSFEFPHTHTLTLFNDFDCMMCVVGNPHAVWWYNNIHSFGRATRDPQVPTSTQETQHKPAHTHTQCWEQPPTVKHIYSDHTSKSSMIIVGPRSFIVEPLVRTNI